MAVVRLQGARRVQRLRELSLQATAQQLVGVVLTRGACLLRQQRDGHYRRQGQKMLHILVIIMMIT